jgi:hypothetical protein
MGRTNVAIVDLPPLAAELLAQQLDQEPGFQLACVPGDLASSAGSLEGVDVLITGSDRAGAAVVAGLLDRHPRLTILGIRPDGRGSVLARLVPEVVRLGDTSPQGLVARLGERPAGWDEVLATELQQGTRPRPSP